MHKFLTACRTFSRDAAEPPRLLSGDEWLFDERAPVCCFPKQKSVIGQGNINAPLLVSLEK